MPVLLRRTSATEPAKVTRGAIALAEQALHLVASTWQSCGGGRGLLRLPCHSERPGATIRYVLFLDTAAPQRGHGLDIWAMAASLMASSTRCRRSYSAHAIVGCALLCLKQNSLRQLRMGSDNA